MTSEATPTPTPTPTTTTSTTTTTTTTTLSSQRLRSGFAMIRQKRPPFLTKEKRPQGDAATAEEQQNAKQRIKVQFLDPVSTTRSAYATSPSNNLKGATPPTDLYDKITAMLQRDYKNTVKQLAYQDVRSKAQNRIDQVQVTCQKLESVVLLEEAPTSPAEWHKIPACHVYLVYCTSLEEYRQKVKPSIQAFVSQLTDKRSRPYLLLYCPTAAANEDSETDNNTTSVAQRPAARAGLALADRLRRRMASGSSTNSNSATTDDNTTTDDAPPLDDFTWNRLSHLTRTEREVYRRLQADFGTSHLCALSVPSMDPQSTMAFKKNEWSAFLQALGTALARGLEESCQKYDEALRQMDAQRAKKGGLLNVAQFFLVKESWAFLYEQFNLPAEALLQYKEVRVVLPDIRTDALHKVVEDDILSGIEGTETRGSSDDIWAELTQKVDAGDMDGFRHDLMEMKQLDPVAPALEDYLYVRETDLLFQMADPVEVLLRSLAYVTAMVDFRLEQVGKPAFQMEIEEWAFSFCWDLKEASQSYLPESAMAGEASCRRPVVESFCRTLCDILAYARLRLLKLAKLHESYGLVIPILATDLQAAWEPWNPSNLEDNDNDKPVSSNGHKKLDAHDSRALLAEAFGSREAFQSCYLEVMKVAIAYNTLAGRHRAAARLRMEVVEIFVQRGQTHKAAETLVTTAAVYDRDQWSACNFLLLFRLAGFQRRISSPADYLQTLFRCFSAGSRTVAPPKTLVALQADLEAIVETDEVKGLLLESSPVFLAKLGLPDRNSQGTSDRKLVRKVCSVGDETAVVLSLWSFLCNDVGDMTITIDLVPYQTHVLAAEDNLPTKESDVVRVLSMNKKVALKPGENQFVFSWMPISSGQFIASSVHLEWKGIKFSYSANEIQKPMVRIDVLPADADQSMTVTPSFLLPGHDQPLRIDFSPGSDEVESGEVQFVCSPGLMLIPPGDETEHWVSNGTIPLPSCPRGDSVELIARVKSVDSDEVDSSPPSVHVKITTQYRSIPVSVSDTDAGKYKSTGALLSHEMDAEIPTLNTAALTAIDVCLASHTIGQALLGITLKCHTPNPFTIRKWHVDLPSFLTLKEGIDINTDILGTVVKEGDVIHFGFLCDAHLAEGKSSSASMGVDIEDTNGFVFRERLDLRLRRAALPRIEMPPIQCLPVKVELSANEGLIGAPVQVEYSFDTSALQVWKGDVLYEVSMESEGWILSGSYRGPVDRSQSMCKLVFMAVPVRPGLGLALPELSIALDGEGLERAFPLAIRPTDTPNFKAFAPSQQSTIVYPANAS